MKCAAKTRKQARDSRRLRVRKKIMGSDVLPRLNVFRSGRFTYAQLISDESGKVIAAANTRTVVADGKSAKCIESAKELGKKVAELAKEKNIERAVFDRNGYVYHGRVKAVAEGAREAGLTL